jgi:hypothetical protein
MCHPLWSFVIGDFQTYRQAAWKFNAAPWPDPLSMCLFACPLPVLYLLGIGMAFIAHPSRRMSKIKPHNAELPLESAIFSKRDHFHIALTAEG